MTNNDIAEIRSKLEKFYELFSQEEFSFIGYEHLYVNTEELLVYDSYAPAGYDREIRGWNNYRTLWEKYVPIDFPNWRIVHADITRLDIHGDWAWSTITFVGRGVRDEQEYTGGQHGTHVWQRINGEWRIVHEHLTALTDREVKSKLDKLTASE